jgi:hypothetical protein
MGREDITLLNRARESMVRRRSELAKIIGAAPLVSVESAEELTKIQHAIEAVDRALADAGQPYLSQTSERE